MRVIREIARYLVQMAPPALIGATVWALSYPLRRKRLEKSGRQSAPLREAALLLFFLYVFGLLALTLTPPEFWTLLFRGQNPILFPLFSGGVNLIPFRESAKLFRFYVNAGMWSAIWINFPGNIIMFMPFGLFSALLSDKPRWWKSTLYTMFFSLFIELFQLVVSRGTDIDDLILNTLGGLMGHWLFLLLRRWAPALAAGCGTRRKGSV